MAKNNINLGTLQGKLGDNVFYRTLGQQRVRAYFKREQYVVNREQADYRARYANLKAIWKWLPDTWKRACRTYRPGQTAFSSFMSQYTNFNQPKDRFSNDVGAFLPINAQLSKGTLNAILNCKVGQMETLTGGSRSIGVMIYAGDDAEGVSRVGDISTCLMDENSNIKRGDIVHLCIAFLQWDIDDWGRADAVAGFPFPYSNTIVLSIPIDPDSEQAVANIGPNVTLIGGYDNQDRYLWGVAPNTIAITQMDLDTISAVGMVMVERPSAQRQQKFSSSILQYYQDQRYILSAQGRTRYDDFAVQTYTHD